MHMQADELNDHHAATEETVAAANPRTSATRWASAAIVALHAFLVTRIVPLGIAFSGDPVVGTDYALHSTRAIEAGEHFLPHGRLWGYDPFHAAGQVAGTVTDLDNKAAEVFVGFVGPLAGHARAFNLFLLLSFVLIPVAYLAGARVLRLRPWAGVAAAALASAAFHFDPYIANWTLFGGYAFIHASVVAPVIVAVLAHQVESPSRRAALWLAATGPFFFTHALTPMLVAVLGAALVPLALRSGLRALTGTAAAIAAIIVINLPWIGPMLADWHTIVPTPGRVQAPVPLFTEMSEYVLSGRVYGLVLPAIAGAAGIALLWRSGRRSVAATFGLGSALLFLTAFEGHHIAAIQTMVEPPRLKVAFPFALAFPAAIALEYGAHRVIQNGRWKWALAAVVVIATAFHTAVLRPVATRAFGTARLRNELDPRASELLTALQTLGDERGRIALEEIGPLDGGSPPFKTYIAAFGPSRTGRAWIGGPYYRGWTGHKIAAFVNGKLCDAPLSDLSDEEIMSRFERYDVTGVAAVQPATIERLRRAEGVLEEAVTVEPYVLFRVLRDAQPMLEGTGEVEYATDRIDVRPTGNGDVVLKLHWDRRLVVAPPLVLSRELHDEDPIGFIRVAGHGGSPFAITVE